MSNDLEPGTFQSRHIGADDAEAREMLAAIGASSIEALVDEAVPARIRLDKSLNLPDGMPEHEFLRELRSIAARSSCAALADSLMAIIFPRRADRATPPDPVCVGPEDHYIRSGAVIPSVARPVANTRAVTSHSTRRLVRVRSSSARSTGHRS